MSVDVSRATKGMAYSTVVSKATVVFMGIVPTIAPVHTVATVFQQ
jgi:hypothetical protein